jgi:hypothetical protein
MVICGEACKDMDSFDTSEVGMDLPIRRVSCVLAVPYFMGP